MGGAVRIVVRKGGEVACQVRGTNYTPGWFRDPLWYEGCDSHVRAYLGQRSDYNEGRAPLLAPEDYGLVVTDYDRGWMLSMQSYASYAGEDVLDLAAFADIPRGDWDGPDFAEGVARYQRLLDGRRISVKEAYRRDGGGSGCVVTPYRGDSFASLVAEAVRLAEVESLAPPGERRYALFTLSTEPLRMRCFDEDRKGAAQMMRALLDLGFEIGAEARAAWDAWMADQEGEDGDI
jgi:hypothetical protein